MVIGSFNSLYQAGKRGDGTFTASDNLATRLHKQLTDGHLNAIQMRIHRTSKEYLFPS